MKKNIIFIFFLISFNIDINNIFCNFWKSIFRFYGCINLFFSDCRWNFFIFYSIWNVIWKKKWKKKKFVNDKLNNQFLHSYIIFPIAVPLVVGPSAITLAILVWKIYIFHCQFLLSDITAYFGNSYNINILFIFKIDCKKIRNLSNINFTKNIWYYFRR